MLGGEPIPCAHIHGTNVFSTINPCICIYVPATESQHCHSYYKDVKWFYPNRHTVSAQYIFLHISRMVSDARKYDVSENINR